MRTESEQKLREEMKELEKQNDEEMHGVMEKNRHEIHPLRTSHSTTMNSNLDKISTLRREAALLKEQDRHDRWVLTELQTQNDNIARPLEMNTNLLHQLESDVATCAKQKQDLNALLPRLRKADEELKAIEWDNEVLLQNSIKLENDRDEWKKKAQQSILSAQRESNFQNLLLECKLTELSMTGERNTAAVAKVLQKASIDLKSLDRSQVCITDVVHEKNEQIELLQQRLKHIKQSHQTLICQHRTLVEEAKQQLNPS
jgi:chaperonin cofactor prefoldin